MAKKNNVVKSKRRMLFLGFSSTIIIVVMTFSIGKYWVEILDKEKEEELKVDANKLQNPDYIARYAREKYFYSKDGEFILQIPEE